MDKLERNNKLNPDWRSSAPARHTMEDLQRTWDLTEGYGGQYEPDVAAGWSRLQKRIQKPPVLRPNRLRRRRFFQLAAAAALLVVALGWWLYQPAAVPETLVMTTGEQEKRAIELPDGTQVVLNENSTLTYTDNLDQALERRIELSGEAYFDVAHRPEQAFVIHTTDVQVRVLGTRFNLRAYPEEDFAEVEVASGSVAFSALASGEQVILQANQYAMLKDGSLERPRSAPSLNRQAWRTQRLFFKNAPLSEAAPLIERYYGIDLQWQAGSDDCPLTGDWENEQLADVLLYLEALTGLEVQKKDAGVYVLRGNCQ